MITEMDKLKRAKQYMDNLAEGINPLTGEELPGDTILNNVRLARCFHYAADVIKQVVENGGSVTRLIKASQPFAITGEELARVKTVKQPVMVSNIVKSINDARNKPEEKKLAAVTITNWLVKKGYLQVVRDSAGKNHKELTERSEGIGISSEKRTGINGPYTAIFYNEKAQRFILDNFTSILENN